MDEQHDFPTVEDTTVSPTDELVALPAGRVQPLFGWPMRALGMIEEACPGFIWRAMHTRPRWRQAVNLTLTHGLLDNPSQFLTRAVGDPHDGSEWKEVLALVGQALLRMKSREIIEAAMGSAPDGILGCLEKIGFEPYGEDWYRRVWVLFTSTDPVAKRKRRVLEQVASIGEEMLDVLDLFDPALMSPTVLSRLRGRREAERLAGELRIIRQVCSSASTDALKASLEKSEWDRWPGLVPGWLSRADRLIPESLPVDDLCERVTPATARAIGREWGNCLGGDHAPSDLTGRLLSGRFAMVAERETGVLVEMVLLDDQHWMVGRLHGKNNQSVTRRQRRRVRELFEPLGVFVPIQARVAPEMRAINDLWGVGMGTDWEIGEGGG